MVTIKRLRECKIDDIVQAWTAGFEGYFVQINMTSENFLARMVLEGLSAEHSIVAFDNLVPIGIVMNGIRTINGKKVAWNGGTGVATAYRRKGIGKRLMDETLTIYKENQVEIATLEAIAENVKAIGLYEKLGYKISDRVAHYSHTGVLKTEDHSFTIIKDAPHVVRKLAYYKPMTSWQTQIKSIWNGESIILTNGLGDALGYVIYKRVWNEKGDLSAINVYQLEISPNQKNEENVIHALLKEVFQGFEGTKNFINYSFANESVIRIMENHGFEQKVQQVMMAKEL